MFFCYIQHNSYFFVFFFVYTFEFTQKNMKKLLFFLFLSTFSFAQNVDRKYIDLSQTEDGISIAVSDGNYFIKFINEKIIETTFVPKGEKNNAISNAVILSTKIKNLTFYSESNSIDCYPSLGIFKIRIQKSPFKISYINNGVEILSEKDGYVKQKHIPLESVRENIKVDSIEMLRFNISTDEILYGGGARALGMNRRGNKLALYNRAHYGYETHAELMNFCIPLVLSSKLYAVHFDNSAIGYLDLDSKKNNTLSYETISGRKTYQVIVGDSWADLLKNYTDLTGKQPLPPRWAFGNFASRFGYHSQQEVENTIQKFEDEKIPVDAIILDLYWFGKTIQGTMGNLDWDKDNFPNPEKMMTNLNAKGVKTILITEPFILTTSSKWQEAVDKNVLATTKNGIPATWNFYFGNTGIIDIFKSEGKVWFWDVYKRLINQGAQGIWGDLGEPEVFPSEVITAGGSADEIHNIYGNNWAKLIAEGYQKDFPNIRPFILMRSGYSGSQRYGMIPWSGDVNRSWGGLQSQMEIALQMGMQGMSYMHSDLGGFAGANLDDELYVRWLQYGVFNPIFRPHAQEEVASEPIYRSDWAKKLAKQAIELRYQLLPYNYNLAFENSQTGKPLMRPLFFEEPNNKELLLKSDGYLWGNDFLIYPVTEKGQKTKEIYFPKSANWYDFYTGKKYEGGSTQIVDLKENSIPTFVRAGAIVPMTKLVQTTENYNKCYGIFHYYFDEKVADSDRILYLDDGKIPNAYENGNYEFIEVNAENTPKSINIEFEEEPGKNNQDCMKFYTLIIHNVLKSPKKVLITNHKQQYEYDKENKTIKIEFTHFEKTEIAIKLK